MALETDYNYTRTDMHFMNGTILDVPYYESPHVRVRDKIGCFGSLGFGSLGFDPSRS